MEFYHSLYLNNHNNNHHRNNHNKFETNDYCSIESLRISNMCIDNILQTFNPYKWKNSKYTNILKLDVTLQNKKNEKCLDSLYVNNNRDNKSNVKLIYSSPYVIFLNFQYGYCTTDILKMKIIEDFEKICIIPELNFRSYENKSIEFISDKKNNFMDSRYVTLKAFCDYYCVKKNEQRPLYTVLDHFCKFINQCLEVFKQTHFIPYFIHPQRLILFKDYSIKIVSPMLLQYIFCPFNTNKKLQHSLFSHPNNKYNNKEYNNNNFQEKQIDDICNLVLDFFHSSFITSISTLLYTNKNYNNIEYILRNENIFEYRRTNKNNDDDDDDDDDDDIICTCKKGICLYFHKHEKLQRLIHNYGCQHVLKLLPIILKKDLKSCYENDQSDTLIATIILQFDIYIEFLKDIIILIQTTTTTTTTSHDEVDN